MNTSSTIVSSPFSASALLPELKKFWGYDSFRPLQAEAIDCVLNRQDSVTVLPTGAGKSLCFQLPALQFSGVGVVVSPLISLMKDQIDALVSAGIAAAALNSSMSDAEKQNVEHRIKNGELRLLYIAPERLNTAATLQLLKENKVSFFAIDEAHCISSWGHDFRPDYRALGKLKTQFPGVALHAFTATATPKVREDIAVQLNLTDCQTLVGSFDRENLVYRVSQRSNLLTQLRAVIDRYPKQAGIIYCISRKEVQGVSEALNSIGYRSRPYHAGLSAEKRIENQDAFINEDIDIVVATVAFGMGIDKSNVRYVIHAGMPKSLEAYQQESGRAGRDGLQSECLMLYSAGDFVTWKRMLDPNNPSAATLLEAMSKYCSQPQCRHKALVEYFGQAFEKENCGACDVCNGELNTIAAPLVLCQKIISCVFRVDQRFGANHVADVLTGSKNQQITKFKHDQVSTYNLLGDLPKKTVRNYIDQLVGQGFLATADGQFPTLFITDQGRKVLRGETTPVLFEAPTAQQKSGKQADDWEGVERDLFEALRALRLTIANENSVPAYTVFHDPTLRDLSRQRPSKLEAMAQISGVGEKKLASFGERFVTAITDYCNDNNVAMDQPGITRIKNTQVSSGKSLSRAGMMKKAFSLFEQGLGIEDVAAQIDRAVSTTSGYLSSYISENNVTDPSPWVDAKLIPKIRAAAEEVGSLERLAPIKEIVEDEVSYEQLRAVIDCLKVETK